MKGGGGCSFKTPPDGRETVLKPSLYYINTGGEKWERYDLILF